MLDLIGAWAGEDAAETLALALEATDLWSIHEASLAEDALGRIPDSALDDDLFDAVIDSESTRLATRRHRRRLAVLVARLPDRLPSGAHPAPAAALLTACSEFDGRAAVRARLLALLLADAVGALRPLRLDLAA